jgi:hypothetical protein
VRHDIGTLFPTVAAFVNRRGGSTLL